MLSIEYPSSVYKSCGRIGKQILSVPRLPTFLMETVLGRIYPSRLLHSPDSNSLFVTLISHNGKVDLPLKCVYPRDENGQFVPNTKSASRLSPNQLPLLEHIKIVGERCHWDEASEEE